MKYVVRPLKFTIYRYKMGLSSQFNLSLSILIEFSIGSKFNTDSSLMDVFDKKSHTKLDSKVSTILRLETPFKVQSFYFK